MLTVSDGDDADRDLWPDATNFLQHNSEAPALYAGRMDVLDCLDDPNAMPMDMDGKPVKARAEDVNPFAIEVCGDGFDENCNGNADEVCVDRDKDGDPSVTDCDDNDPKRHHPTAMDPYPDPPNCCGYSLGKKGTADENTDYLHATGDMGCFAATCTRDMMLCPMQRCGDKIDEGCRGSGANDPKNDTTCVVDEDCDGYPAMPQGNDCDDHDPAVHPNALEPCGSTKDLNCDGVVNGGCVPCDLDGDGFERNDPTNGCPDAKDKNPGKADCNDYDASVFPGSTTQCGGSEAGMTSLGRLTCSLRQFCRSVYEPTGVIASGTPKVSSFGWLVGDMDCNGTAYQGCPPANCDADGDGWPVNDGTCAAVDGKFDCDDTNPTIYPGAPKSCGSGPSEDCTTQKDPCTQDADGDGWNAGPDCNDGDPTVHPWAVELCDGKDNDCDGLIDEGNPDTMGKPLVMNGSVTACTDSDVGECAKTQGVCVCAIALPMSTINPASRMACPTETSGAAKPPHCFGAGQPHPQTCDSTNPKDDDCNGKNDDVMGTNLTVKGMPCGINGPGPLSQCKQGVIVGCDSSQTNCFAQFGRIPMSQSWYVCSSDAVCPVAELCNGLDDDCDGTLAGIQTANPPLSSIPANDEIDHDADGYLACTTCAGLTLASGIAGCSDCDDTTNKKHPGHSEDCDGIDNACAGASWSTSPPGPDGSDQCKSQTCCSNQAACRDLTTDTSNCGSCGHICIIPLKATTCGSSACMCNKVPGCDESPTSGVYCNASGGGGNGNCDVCMINSHCGDGCNACGPGQQCQADASRPGHYTCGCTDDSGCTNPSFRYCNKTSGNCQGTAPDGHPCGGATGVTCTNSCVDNYCCNTPCTAQCSACNISGSEGICTPVPGPSSPPVGTRSCTGNGAMPCGGYCSGGANCFYPGQSGTVNCTPNLSCGGALNNTLQPQSTCNSAGGCTMPTAGACAGNVQCATTTTCKSSTCGGDTDCITNYYCKSGVCTIKGNAGSNCGNNNQCTGGTCCNTGGMCGTVGTTAGCGPGCAVCSGNTPSCIDPGTGTLQCGCTADSQCGGSQWCDTSVHQCKSCAIGAPCGGASNHCSNSNCGGSNNWCNASLCDSCSNGAGPCGTGGACQTYCNRTSGRYCNGSSQCQSCSNSDLNGCGPSCGVCSGNTPACIDPGSGTFQCGCTADSQCAGSQWCDTSVHQCKSCAIGAPCGGGSNHCSNTNCGSNNWCNASVCDSCANGAGPCGGGGACQTYCNGSNGRYCNVSSQCQSCTSSDPKGCGSGCAVCGVSQPQCVSGVCQCTQDSDCSGQWCKKGSPNTCTARPGTGGGSCDPTLCVAPSPSCQECQNGVPCASPSPCP
jgi:hypothetical protein